MYQDLPPLNWLRAFDASARLGNFTLAGEALGLTPSAVSYQIRGLEEHLGHKLFRRNHRSVELTKVGHDYLPVVSKAFADLDATTANLFGQASTHEVTLRCIPSLNLLWLAPRLSRFRRLYPSCHLRLLSTAWDNGESEQPADVDIRFGDGNWTDGVVLPLMTTRVVAVGAPSLAQSIAETPNKAAELARLPHIEVTGVVDTWRHFYSQQFPDTPSPTACLKVDQSIVALELASNGLGIALIAEVFADPYLRDGRLCQIGDAALKTTHAHYLVVPHQTQHQKLEVGSLINWLQEEARPD